jgi:predicted TIM-barrel fold metal-dependent hydrolase
LRIEGGALIGERVGADRLVMGSDYPVGEKDPVGFVRSLFGEEEAAMTCGGNAERLLS